VWGDEKELSVRKNVIIIINCRRYRRLVY